MAARRCAAFACVLLLGAAGCAGSAPAPGEDRTAATPAATAKPPIVPVQRAAGEPVPILMYHVIGPAPADARLPSLFVAPSELRAHVRALQRAGYHGVTLQDVWDAWHRGGRLPRRPVVVSFDDGTEGQVRHALPLLRGAGWTAVLNLAWRFLPEIGGTAAVRRLVRAGWEVDSHSLTHADLTRLPAAGLRRELSQSRARIRRTFGEPADFFAYPSGRYDGRVKRAVRAAGYRGATTVRRGFATPTGDPYALRRVQVDGGMSGAALLRRLRDLRP